MYRNRNRIKKEEKGKEGLDSSQSNDSVAEVGRFEIAKTSENSRSHNLGKF
jgi:hypothetical protein